MTNRDREEGHVTTIPGNEGAALATVVSAPVTVPRSPVPGNADTPSDGHVPGNGHADDGNAPVPADGSKRRFHVFGRPRPAGNEDGNRNEERSPVPVPAVPSPAGKVAAEPVTEAQNDSNAQNDETDETDKNDDKKAGGFRTWNWPVIGMWAAIIVMTAMTTVLASSGQIDGTWTWAGLEESDDRRYLLPGATEFAVVGFLLIGRYALYKQHSPFLWWGIAAVFAVLAVMMNSVHGEEGHKLEQGLIFGTASAASLAMWFAKFWIDYLGIRKDRGEITGLRPKVLTLKAIFSFPRIAFRANLIIARCEKVTTSERAYELAEMWRWVFADAREGKENRKTSSRTAWMTVYQELGMKVIEPQNIKLAKVTFAAPPPPPPPPAPVPTAVEAPPAPRQRPAAQDAEVPAADKPASSAGKAPVPAAAPKITPAKPVPDEWWTEHAEHIKRVQEEIPDWATRDKLTVNDVQAVIPNRTNAANTAACIRVLRAKAAAANN
jgi:hypothetical protein